MRVLEPGPGYRGHHGPTGVDVVSASVPVSDSDDLGASPGEHVPVLQMDNIVQEFRVRARSGLRPRTVSAVAGVSLAVARGETFALVGETGSGKSTLARSIIRAPAPKSGRVLLSGREVSGSPRSVSKADLRRAKMIFQDPFTALDPKWTVEKIVTEPLVNRGDPNDAARRRKFAEILGRVGMSVDRFAMRNPGELSGGQAQRVAIARALVASPDLVICDEPVTALDVSVQAQILQLLAELKRDLSLTYLLIAHDLAVVSALADRVGTMYLGKLCEVGSTGETFETPAHPYTAALLSAIPPHPDEQIAVERIRLVGEPPSPLDPPSGCRFRTRCAYAQERCAVEIPALREISPGHEVACHFPLVPVRD